MGDPPPAYRLAVSLREQLGQRFETILREIVSADSKAVLRGIRALLARGRAAVNMSVPSLVRFLNEGAWLNIYEAVARDTGLTGSDLEREIQKRLGKFEQSRLKIDGLLQFGEDTHYASLNLGGPGPQRYGPCCVVFDLKHWVPHYTCYAGDSIRACFSSDGKQALSDAEILADFAVGDDIGRLVVVRHQALIARQGFCIDPAEMRNALEAEDSLIEFHLHGPITRSQILEVRLPRQVYQHWRDLLERAPSAGSPRPWEYDVVPYLRQMIDLLEKYEVPLILAEG